MPYTLQVGNAKKIIDPLIRNERVLSIIGVWPQYQDHVMFCISVVYYTSFLILGYWDLLDSLGNLDMAMVNVLATISASKITVLHLCAKLSILSYRIRNIQPKPSERFKDNIRRAVIMHLELTNKSLCRLSKTLNDSYHTILLTELIISGFRVGLVLYVVLIKLSSEPAMAYNFLFLATVLTVYLYLYSYIGEQLIYESQRVGDAFYDINWPEVTSRDRKILLICITNGQQAMYVTAGKFYIFSLSGFTGVSTIAPFYLLAREHIQFVERRFC
ncbi:uncharacterized protein LOC128884584 [Hylaeus volcanicus]|uniref:uncharacterized protein LOC128884584 n=1 Tax=Hylaeus volcanicus TaxID=313075 RepID=UPI0023B79613|nr:uncharacterized protein LOC128884584 [Hylaeus volcanicus]